MTTIEIRRQALRDALDVVARISSDLHVEGVPNPIHARLAARKALGEAEIAIERLIEAAE